MRAAALITALGALALGSACIEISRAPEAGVDGAADTAPADTGDTDTGAADTGAADTGTPPDGAADATADVADAGCTKGERACQDRAFVVECDDDGVWKPKEACEQDERCALGQCVPGASCHQVLSCFLGCEDPAGTAGPCQATCLDTASLAAMPRFETVAGCYVNEQCGDAAAPLGCLADNCVQAASSCAYGGLPEGDGTCGDLLTCSRACEPTDDACQDACGADKAEEERQKFLRLWFCLLTVCGDPLAPDGPGKVAFESCAQFNRLPGGQCAAQQQACKGGLVTP